MLEQKKLKEILSYCPTTGTFIWLVDAAKGTKKGTIAGYITNTGYWCIGISRKYYLAHQLAFLYMEGKFITFVDHIDGNRINNKWSNLREVIGNSNYWNRKVNTNSSTGIKGVYYCLSNKGYVGSVSKNKRRFCRTFKTLAEAEAWVKCKREELHGKYARHE